MPDPKNEFRMKHLRKLLEYVRSGDVMVLDQKEWRVVANHFLKMFFTWEQVRLELDNILAQSLLIEENNEEIK